MHTGQKMKIKVKEDAQLKYLTRITQKEKGLQQTEMQIISRSVTHLYDQGPLWIIHQNNFKVKTYYAERILF